MPTEELYNDTGAGTTTTGAGAADNGGSSSGQMTVTSIVSDRNLALDEIQNRRIGRGHSDVDASGILDVTITESIPIGFSDSSYWVDTTNSRYDARYIMYPKFVMGSMSDVNLAALPSGRVTYMRQSIKDIDPDNGKYYKLYYPVFEGMEPVATELYGGKTLEYGRSSDGGYGSGDPDDPATPIDESDPSGTQAALKEIIYDGTLGNFKYSSTETAALKARFGAPDGYTIGRYIKESIDAMVIEILTTTIGYGHTFSKIKEGEFEKEDLYPAIFGEEEDQPEISPMYVRETPEPT
jgi:hypothetical protein